MNTLCLFISFSYATTSFIFFFFNDTATTEIYTLSLHDALPISPEPHWNRVLAKSWSSNPKNGASVIKCCRSEEHTSELQSRLHLVCRLLLEKKKKKEDLNIYSKT